MQGACNAQYLGQGRQAVVLDQRNAYSWVCRSTDNAGIDVNKSCSSKYGYGATSGLVDASNPYSWFCQWQITAQMQGAKNWAIAEKNSPNPAYSDRLGHNWSGYCEAFVEQAEGLKFTFTSALVNYNWEASQSRIHTDANPPIGALVFYGGSVYGHVAVSIGNGQAIGTQGGQTSDALPVRQYPVVGFFNIPYLGWAYPQGS